MAYSNYESLINKQINKMLELRFDDDDKESRKLSKKELESLVKKSKAGLESSIDDFIDSVNDLKLKDFPYLLGSVPLLIYQAVDRSYSRYFFNLF